MNLFRKLFRGNEGSGQVQPQDHALLVYIPLSQAEFGESAERVAIFELEDQLVSALSQASAGEFDGNEFGGGECTLYMYGSDADRLFRSVEGVLRKSPVATLGRVVLRYGPPGATEIEINLNSGQ